MESFLATNLVAVLQLLAFVGGGIWLISALKSVQQTQNIRLAAVEGELHALRNVVVDLARQGERIAAMDQRMLSQGARIDSTAQILNGRMEAINNIVAGHTAQLNSLPRYRDGRRTPEKNED